MITNHLAFAQLPPVARRSGPFAFGLAICTLGLSFSASAQSIFTTFDVPGSVQTIPISINSKGAVIGLYTDQNFVGHGFLRSPGGIFTTIDPPGSVFTVAQSINSAGGDYGTLPRELCDLRIPSSFRWHFHHNRPSELHPSRRHSKHQLGGGDHGSLHRRNIYVSRLPARS